MNHDDDDGDHGNFRFHSHHELPRPNLIWFLKTYLLILVTHQPHNIHIQIRASYGFKRIQINLAQEKSILLGNAIFWLPITL